MVLVHTDEGLTGIGESDVNPWIARACVEATGTHTFSRGLTTILVGEDPMDIEGLWRKMYQGTIMDGRRGAVIHVIGAIDMALWDLKGKALGKPVHELLGGPARAGGLSLRLSAAGGPHLRRVPGQPRPPGRGGREIWASGRSSPRSRLNGPFAPRRAPRVLRAPQPPRWWRRCAMPSAPTWRSSWMFSTCGKTPRPRLRTICDWEEFDLFFLETADLGRQPLDEYARLHEEAPMRIACGELQATRFEFAELMDTALIDVAQPDVGRGRRASARRWQCAAWPRSAAG